VTTYKVVVDSLEMAFAIPYHNATLFCVVTFVEAEIAKYVCRNCIESQK